MLCFVTSLNLLMYILCPDHQWFFYKLTIISHDIEKNAYEAKTSPGLSFSSNKWSATLNMTATQYCPLPWRPLYHQNAPGKDKHYICFPFFSLFHWTSILFLCSSEWASVGENQLLTFSKRRLFRLSDKVKSWTNTFDIGNPNLHTPPRDRLWHSKASFLLESISFYECTRAIHI